MVGTSGGWLQLHSHDGTLLHRQQLHALPVVAVHTRCSPCASPGVEPRHYRRPIV